MKKAVTITLDENVLRLSLEQAAKENRTLSNWIETLIIESGKK